MRADGKSDDAELIRQILDGDQNAFSAICAKYEARLHAFVSMSVHNHEDAEEIVQDVFVKVAQNLEMLKASTKLWNWMCSIASQLIVARYRQSKTNLEFTSLGDGSHAQELHEEASLDAYQVSQQQAKEDELLESASRAIAKLPDLDRRAMLLQQEGRSYREIAQELGLTEAAVKHRLYRAKRKAKAIADEMEGN